MADCAHVADDITRLDVPLVCMFHQNVKLIPYAKEHDRNTLRWLNDPELKEHFGLTKTVTAASHREWFSSQKNFLIWAILDSDERHQGNISLHLTPRHCSAYLQMYIGNITSRGKGLGWGALLCVLNHTFTNLGMHRVWLHTLPENKAANNLYRKAGFLEEGIERESILRNGKFCSQKRWSLLASEWKLGLVGQHA
jgi:RimJ/RimL family protein N-acetyltransferase